MFGDTFFWFIEIAAKLLDGLRLLWRKDEEADRVARQHHFDGQ